MEQAALSIYTAPAQRTRLDEQGKFILSLAIDQVCESISNINSNQQKTVQALIQIQALFTTIGTALTAILPTAGVGGTILSLIAPEIPKSVTALVNNLSSGVNVELKKFNYSKPYSAKSILSKYNKVN